MSPADRRSREKRHPSVQTAAEEEEIALTLLVARQLLAKKKVQESFTVSIKLRMLCICLNSHFSPYFTAFLCKLGSLCVAVCFDKIL